MPPKLLASGQHSYRDSKACIATLLSGKPCPNPRNPCEAIPYCIRCMQHGDPSLKVVQHRGGCGKILVAARTLPATYYVGWWGHRTPGKKIPEKDLEWALDTGTGASINAVDFPGSQLKYAACPGPNELATIGYARASDFLLCKTSPTTLLFSTRCEIPKGYQITMTYSSGVGSQEAFFKERGIVRKDIGTKENPALTKQARKSS